MKIYLFLIHTACSIDNSLSREKKQKFSLILLIEFKFFIVILSVTTNYAFSFKIHLFEN